MIDLKIEYREQLLKMIQIRNVLVEDSKNLDEKSKEAFINFGNYWIDRIGKETFTLTQLKSITSDILTYWNESIGIDTEYFWIELEKNKIHFERNDELNFALKKGRFRRVDIGMGARKDWSVIKDFNSIQTRFSKEDIERLGLIIVQDENKRVEILRKCLCKKEIPKTQYLKFGECWAYMNNCKLWGNYFSEKEVEELYQIWRGFGSNKYS
jgi:hypothetical protein